MLHHVEAVGQRRGKAEVLLDHHDGVALGRSMMIMRASAWTITGARPSEISSSSRKLGAGAQDARDGEHLLLAARQARALAVAALRQVGEHGVDLVDRHAFVAALEGGRQQQVFFGRQARKNAALFGAIADAQVRHLVRRHADGFGAVHLDAALAAAGQAEHGAHRGRTPCPVAAQQRDDFARLHDHVHAMQHVRFAVPRVQVLDFECGNEPSMRSLQAGRRWCPCRLPSPADFWRLLRRGLPPEPRRVAGR